MISGILVVRVYIGVIKATFVGTTPLAAVSSSKNQESLIVFSLDSFRLSAAVICGDRK